MAITNHIDYSVTDNCLNLSDSYGEICVKCNCCGRFDKATQYQAQINVYTRQLQEEKDFDNWVEGAEELQMKNIKLNIEYYENLIKQAEEKLLKQQESGVEI